MLNLKVYHVTHIPTSFPLLPSLSRLSSNIFFQTITNNGVLCVLKHLSDNNNDRRDSSKCPFQTRQKDSGNKFPKAKLQFSVEALQPDTGNLTYSLHQFVCSALYLPKRYLCIPLNHVHLPYRRCLQQGSAQA